MNFVQTLSKTIIKTHFNHFFISVRTIFSFLSFQQFLIILSNLILKISGVSTQLLLDKMENEIIDLPEVEMEEEEVAEEAVPANNIRNFRPRQPVYTQAQREQAIKLLNAGVPCRQVAKQMGPRCSSGTPIRWRLLKRKQDAARKAMEAMLKRPGNQHPQPRR